MASNPIGRALWAALAIAAGLGGALAAGASLLAALVAMLGGAIAFGLMRTHSPPSSSAPASVLEEPASDLPDAAALLGSVDEPLLLVRGGRVALANNAARAVLGSHVEGVDARLAIRHPAAADCLHEQPLTTRCALTGLGDRDRRWVMTASPVPGGGRLIHLSDRSEKHASEQMRTDFVANASHELRTPLATLLGFLETLQDEDAAEDKTTRSRFLRIMFDEARRMHRLVDDLISLSRIEAERFSLPRTPVDLLAVVEEVRTSCRTLVDARQSAIEVVGSEVQPVVPGDRTQLVQLFQNLVVNALKYGRSGKPVLIRFASSGTDMLVASVIDHGDGIPSEHLPRLTERFYRVDPSRSRAMGGTGLGLAIVKHIVGRHRGRLDIRSELGKGTAVHIHLPRAPESLSSKSHGSVTGDGSGTDRGESALS